MFSMYKGGTGINLVDIDKYAIINLVDIDNIGIIQILNCMSFDVV